MEKWIYQGSPDSRLQTIHVISDSVGVTGQAIARAAAASFNVSDPLLEVLPNVRSSEEMLRELSAHLQMHRDQGIDGAFLVFYTLISSQMCADLEAFIDEHDDVVGCDLMTGPIRAIAQATGITPTTHSGTLHSVNEHYFERIDAMEFTIQHDDGRNPQDLPLADIVLLGVSRSSKTPLSIYLSQLGYRVANVPLDPQSEPPKEIFEVDPSNLFGLMVSPETLVNIRKRRLGKAIEVAASYADLEYVYQDLEKARALMRRLGCIVIRTDNRAIEETAQEVLRYYENAHPQKRG